VWFWGACKIKFKLCGEFVGAANFSSVAKAHPIVTVRVNGVRARSLVDSGSTVSIVTRKLCDTVRSDSCGSVQGVADTSVIFEGESVVNVAVDGSVVRLKCLVMRSVMRGIDMIIGMDLIKRMGGVYVSGSGEVQWGLRSCLLVKDDRGNQDKGNLKRLGVNLHAGNPTPDQQVKTSHDIKSEEEAIKIDDEDFHAEFKQGRWIVRWKWKDKPPNLCGLVTQYKVKEVYEEKYYDELDVWIKNGWLRECRGMNRLGCLPLMCVHQSAKEKVRPVMDFRELNQYIRSHTMDTRAINDVLREWRIKSSKCKILDLRNAYLQLYVDESLWNYQKVVVKNKSYVLTRLGFGLVSAPKIMSNILEVVLSKNTRINEGTSHYVDDIIVDETIVSVKEVRDHLSRFGLECKEPLDINNARVLGLNVSARDGRLWWKRGTPVSCDVYEQLKKKEVHSICGKLVSHFPVVGWLRVSCSYIKRQCNPVDWSEYASKNVVKMSKM